MEKFFHVCASNKFDFAQRREKIGINNTRQRNVIVELLASVPDFCFEFENTRVRWIRLWKENSSHYWWKKLQANLDNDAFDVVAARLSQNFPYENHFFPNEVSHSLVIVSHTGARKIEVKKKNYSIIYNEAPVRYPVFFKIQNIIVRPSGMTPRIPCIRTTIPVFSAFIRTSCTRYNQNIDEGQKNCAKKKFCSWFSQYVLEVDSTLHVCRTDQK